MTRNSSSLMTMPPSIEIVIETLDRVDRGRSLDVALHRRAHVRMTEQCVRLEPDAGVRRRTRRAGRWPSCPSNRLEVSNRRYGVGRRARAQIGVSVAERRAAQEADARGKLESTQRRLVRLRVGRSRASPPAEQRRPRHTRRCPRSTVSLGPHRDVESIACASRGRDDESRVKGHLEVDVDVER